MQSDAERLSDWLASQEQPTTVQHTPKADYAYRLVVPREAWGQFLAAAAAEIDYPNFKSAVGERQGHARADVYLDVWEALLALQRGR